MTDTGKNKKAGRVAWKALAFVMASVVAVFLAAGPVLAAPKGTYCQRMAAKGKDLKKCKQEEADAAVKLKHRRIDPQVREFCDSVATSMYGKSPSLMLQCVEDMERRKAGGDERGRRQ